MVEAIVLRRLRWRDTLFCWRLASDPVVRHNSLNKSKPSVFGHIAWMNMWGSWDEDDPKLSRAAWIVEVAGERAGVVRVSALPATLASMITIDIAIAESHRGKRLASPVIFAATLAGWGLWGPDLAIATISRENVASIKAFEKVGFTCAGQAGVEDGFDTYVLMEKPRNEWTDDT
jgi:RimJ/RimL family protein N-acetyltransferase